MLVLSISTSCAVCLEFFFRHLSDAKPRYPSIVDSMEGSDVCVLCNNKVSGTPCHTMMDLNNSTKFYDELQTHRRSMPCGDHYPPFQLRTKQLTMPCTIKAVVYTLGNIASHPHAAYFKPGEEEKWLGSCLGKWVVTTTTPNPSHSVLCQIASFMERNAANIELQGAVGRITVGG
eukprot:PhF_6_TR20210/c0_g2_i1/m.29292